MSVIFRPPRGLLDFLGIKATGQNPDVLTREVRPTVSLDAKYWSSIPVTRQEATGSTTIAGGGGGTFVNGFGVQEGELWRIRGIACSYYGTNNTTSTGLASFAAGIKHFGSVRPALIGEMNTWESYGTSAYARATTATYRPGPLELFEQGYFVGIHLAYTDVAGPWSYWISAEYQVLRI